MTFVARKFTTEDVEAEEDLRVFAHNYAADYTGDYPYLVMCQEMLAQGQRLTNPMLKGILNCMLHNPRARVQLDVWMSDHWERVIRERVLRERAQVRVNERATSQQLSINVFVQPAKARPRRAQVVRWKRRYVVSTWRETLTCHILHTASQVRVPDHLSHLRYQTSGLRSLCRGSTFAMAETYKDIPEGMHLCNACIQADERQGGKNSVKPGE